MDMTDPLLLLPSPPTYRTENKGAKGVLVTDHEGLCLTARGTLEAGNAARFTSIVDNAAKLGGGEEPPTITIDTDKSTIVIVSKDGFITAVCK